MCFSELFLIVGAGLGARSQNWGPKSQNGHQGFRRLTRDSRVSVGSLEIPVSRIFARKKSRKIVKNGFSDSRDQNKNLKFLWFFYTTSISYINPLFRAPRPPGPLKSRPRGQNLPGDPLIAHSAHRESLSAQFCTLGCLFLTLICRNLNLLPKRLEID